MKGRKAFVLVLFFCISITIAGVGVKNLFAEWVSCSEAPAPRCNLELMGCWAEDYEFMECLLFGCIDPLKNPYDCHPEP